MIFNVTNMRISQDFEEISARNSVNRIIHDLKEGVVKIHNQKLVVLDQLI